MRTNESASLSTEPELGAPPTETRVWYCALLLIAIGVGAYANSFSGVMLFDDIPHIVDNEKIHHLWPLGDLLRTRRAVLNVTFAANYAVHGLDVWGYHLVNLVVHLLACLTLFGLVRRTLLTNRLRRRFQSDATYLAFFASALWLVHPLNTQSVTYIVQRGEALMGLFYFLVLYALVRADISSRPRLWQLIGVLACVLGMSSKAVMVTAPVVALLYDRTFLSDGWRSAFRRHGAFYVGLVASWGVLFALGIVQSTFNTEPNLLSPVGFSYVGVTPWQYACTQPGVILHYVRLAFWPVGLCLDEHWPLATTTSAIAGPAVVIGVLVALSFAGTVVRSRVGFLLIAFFLILSPTSSIVPIKDLAFEHRMYLPLAVVTIGVVIAVYWLIETDWIERRGWCRRARRIAATSSVIVLLLLGFGTVRRNRDYRSEEAMWRDVVAKRPENARAYVGVGAALQKRGFIDEAIAQYRRSLELNPNYADAWFDMGSALQAQGKIEQAVDAYERVIHLVPQRLPVYEVLARLLAQLGRHNQAAHWFGRLSALDPHNADWPYEQGNALADAGHDEQAIDAYRASTKLDPTNARCWINLGNAYRRIGSLEEAIKAYDAALRVDSTFALAWVNRGNALGAAGRTDQAVESFQRAVALDPKLVAAYIGLGRALRLQERIEAAREAFKTALSLAPDSQAARQGLTRLNEGSKGPTSNQ